MYGKAEVKLMGDIYGALYEYESKDNLHDTARSNELIGEFDEKIQTDDEFRSLVKDFATVRGDFVSSDREVIAFMLMYKYV